MRHLLLILLLIPLHCNGEIYKSINPDGSITYSDQPIEGGKAITPPAITPTPAVKLPPRPSAEPKQEGTALPYKVFKIVSPASNETIRDNTGAITVSIELEPALQTPFDHTVSIYLDGKAVANKLVKTSHKLTDVFRGRHSISARVIDKDGSVVKMSNLVFVNVMRFSTLHKQQIDRRERPDNPGQNPQTWPTIENTPGSDSNESGDTNTNPQGPWPTLPDYSNPSNVWPSLPNTPPPSNTQ